MTRFNFKEYSITTWIAKNKKDIKLLLMALISLATYISSGATKPISVLIAGVVGTLCKLLLDAVDYYISE